MRYTGTRSIGIRTPIIKKGDDLVEIIVNSLEKAQQYNEINLRDKDVIGITESVVGRSQGNYVTVDDIAESVKKVLNNAKHIGVVFPIMSRNRFSLILKGIARAADKVTVLFRFPDDEVGNRVVDDDILIAKDALAASDCGYLTEMQLKLFGWNTVHKFTGIDYIEYYRKIIEEENAWAEMIFSDRPEMILKFTGDVIDASIHHNDYRVVFDIVNPAIRDCLEKLNGIYRLNTLCAEKTDKCGYNEQYGLLGSNLATQNSLKLFPRDCDELCRKVQERILEKFGKHVEVLVYGDGAFKDPVCGIWELADPVTSPGFTSGLKGTPNELKLKYLADNTFGDSSDCEASIKDAIRKKDQDLKGSMVTQGTTPRQYTDLLASLCDLTSGSGDKGTPVILIQGYFDNFAD